MITSKFAVGTIKSSRQAIAKLQLKTSVLQGPVSNLIECMRKIQFTDCDENSKITTRLLKDFKDYKISRTSGRLSGLRVLIRDYNKDYSEDCMRLQGSVRPLGLPSAALLGLCHGNHLRLVVLP